MCPLGELALSTGLAAHCQPPLIVSTSGPSRAFERVHLCGARTLGNRLTQPYKHRVHEAESVFSLTGDYSGPPSTGRFAGGGGSSPSGDLFPQSGHGGKFDLQSRPLHDAPWAWPLIPAGARSHALAHLGLHLNWACH